MKKKIMMLTSIWKSEYVCRVTEGVHRRLSQEGYDLYIFNAYDMRGNENCFLQEHRIYKLPDVTQFDGVLIAINSVGTEGMVKDLVEECHRLQKPIYSIDQRFDGVCLAGIDNRESMYKIVEHMITEHGCKVFNYLGGPKDHAENKQRFQGFCDCLKDYKIEIDPKRVSHRSFLMSDGGRAYNAWAEENLHVPDVVICANDEMALGYTMVAREHNIIVPHDLKVTGFDNMIDGQKNFPSITSVKRNWEELGYQSASMLIQMAQGKGLACDFYISGDVVQNESCGCHAGERSARDAYVELYKENKYYEVKEEIQRNVRQLLCECHDEKELQQSLNRATEMSEISEMAVCINENWSDENPTTDYADYVRVLCGNEKEIICTKKQLIPSKWLKEDEEPSIYIFGALYCGKKPSGYAVMHYQPDFLPERKHKTLLESIGLSLDSILRREELNQSNQRLSELYVRDSLTGLYNRFGYKKEGFTFFEKHHGEVYLAYFDIDGLKKINDTYGHAYGDIAISGLAKAISQVFSNDQICVRMGGDEFLVIGALSEHRDMEMVKSLLDEKLSIISEEQKMPISIKASVGFLENKEQSDNLEELVKKADKIMYDIKQKRKKEQQK